jgi:hypothetical protein
MRADKLQAALLQIQEILNELLVQDISRVPQKASSQYSPAAAPRTANALPKHALRLRDGGFFKPPKTAVETHSKLQSTYPYELNRVQVVLLRLQKKKQLRKTLKIVGKRKQVAYGW